MTRVKVKGDIIMDARLQENIPQEGTSFAGESLPETSSGRSPHRILGGGTILLHNENEKNGQPERKSSVEVNNQAPTVVTPTGNKKLMQQSFHPSLFYTRPRSASLDNTSRPAKAGTNHDSNRNREKKDVVKPPSWQRIPEPRNPKRKKMSTSPPPEGIKTSNRFSELPIDLTEDHNSNNLTKKIPKPPPIILYGIDDINKLTELLVTTVQKEQFTYKIINKNQMRINCTEMEVYKKLITLVRENGLIGHTFNKKDERLFRIVIRNLHPTTSLEAIKEAVEKTGNTVASEIINAKYGPDKKPTSTFFVNILPGPNNKAAKEIKYINHQVVVIEDPKKRKSVVQCQRCQQYGHSKNYCMRPYRCVKCAQSHKTSDCPKIDRSTPAVCALCQGPHPANYKGCQVYTEILARRAPKRQPGPKATSKPGEIENKNKYPHHYSLSVTHNTHVPQEETYAGVLKKSTESPTTQTLESLLYKQCEKFDLIIQQMGVLMNLMAKLLDRSINK